MPLTSKEIKEAALSLGIDRIGIIPADAFDAERLHLADWLDRGFHADMAWMEREPDKRSDARLLLSGARSIVVCAVNYYTPHEHPDRDDSGKLSRYAWGDDYHDVVGGKLRLLLAWIGERHPGVNGKLCLDTSPFMDKAAAARAGIGWLGKHSNIISKEFGSWIFIGSLLLDIELEYETVRVEDHCGSCTACLDACPTGAIAEPYVVDSRKCISYATIELRSEELPREIASELNGWLYGCDICQDVCPWNRFEKPSKEARFEPRQGETAVAVDTIIAMTHEEYVERFRRSAIKRAKLSGLKRNASALKQQEQRRNTE